MAKDKSLGRAIVGPALAATFRRRIEVIRPGGGGLWHHFLTLRTACTLPVPAMARHLENIRTHLSQQEVSTRIRNRNRKGRDGTKRIRMMEKFGVECISSRGCGNITRTANISRRSLHGRRRFYYCSCQTVLSMLYFVEEIGTESEPNVPSPPSPSPSPYPFPSPSLRK